VHGRTFNYLRFSFILGLEPRIARIAHPCRFANPGARPPMLGSSPSKTAG